MQGQIQSIVPGLELLEVLDDKRNEVWRARRVAGGADVADVADVAVKLLKPAHEPLLPRRFGTKNRTLARVVAKNPGWVPPLDHGVAHDGRSYVVHPYFSNLSLADQLDYGPTPWFPAAKLIAQVAQILASAHLEDWTFGHLRPSNVVLDDLSEPSVTVYGTSTRRFDDGTPEFTAPEMRRGEQPTPASDVYSLALLLASLILGRAVDHDAKPAEVLGRINGQAPRRILEIIDYGLSANLRNRFADASKLAKALWVALDDPDDIDTPQTGISSDRRLSNDHVLSALMAGPLVEDAEPSPRSDPDHDQDHAPERGSDHEAVSQPDDPTDPTIDSIEPATDPFGSVAPLDEPTSPPFQVSAAGPLSELLGRRPAGGYGPGALPDRSSDNETNDLGGRENEDHSHHRSAALAADPSSQLRPRLTDVWADRVFHLLAVVRRNGASSAALVGLAVIAGLVGILGAGQIRAGSASVSDGAPAGTASTVAAVEGDRPSSPLNDPAPLDGVRSLSHAEATANQPVLREPVAAARESSTTTVFNRTEEAKDDDSTAPTGGRESKEDDDGEAADSTMTTLDPSETSASTEAPIPSTTATTQQATTTESPPSTRRRWWTRPPRDDDDDD